MKITVVGGNGGTGAVVVRLAAERGHQVTSLSRTGTSAPRAGVRRLIVQSSLGVGDSMELLPGPARVFAKAALGRALADHAEQEAAVEASGLDWTVLRPGGLTDGPATGSVVVQETAERRPMKSRTSRADVATSIVDALGDPATLGRFLSMGTS